MEMEGLQPVMAEDGIEEVGEGGNQARDDAAREEGVEGAPRSLWLDGASLELGLPLLVVLPRRQQTRGGEVLLRDIGRVQSPLVLGGRRSSLDLAGRHWSEARRGIEADLEISEARSVKGDLEQGE